MFIAGRGAHGELCATALMKFPPRDHRALRLRPQRRVAEERRRVLPYSDPFAKIIDHCIVTPEDNANLMIHLSDQATELGGSEVTTLKMLQAIARRITWKSPKIVCWDVFDNAEGHAEAGGRSARSVRRDTRGGVPERSNGAALKRASGGSVLAERELDGPRPRAFVRALN